MMWDRTWLVSIDYSIEEHVPALFSFLQLEKNRYKIGICIDRVNKNKMEIQIRLVARILIPNVLLPVTRA